MVSFLYKAVFLVSYETYIEIMTLFEHLRQKYCVLVEDVETFKWSVRRFQKSSSAGSIHHLAPLQCRRILQQYLSKLQPRCRSRSICEDIAILTADLDTAYHGWTLPTSRRSNPSTESLLYGIDSSCSPE
jgi:hypothetical protein